MKAGVSLVIRAERALLGAVLSDPAGQAHLLDVVSADDMARPYHGQVLAAMQRLRGRGVVPGPLPVRGRSRRTLTFRALAASRMTQATGNGDVEAAIAMARRAMGELDRCRAVVARAATARASRRDPTAARTRAARNGWPAPMGLDDDQIDDPAYQPRAQWHPATGTGAVTPAGAARARRGAGRRSPGREPNLRAVS